jgi:hypothetical protein
LEKFSRATQSAADTSGFADEYSNSKIKIYTLIDVLATVDAHYKNKKKLW